jgi:hypothetical protein
MMEKMITNIASMNLPEGSKIMLKDFESQIMTLKISERTAAQLAVFGNQGSVHLRRGMGGIKREWVEDVVFKSIYLNKKEEAVVRAEKMTEIALMDYGSDKAITYDVYEDFRLMTRAIVLMDCIGSVEKEFAIKLAKSYNINSMEKLLQQ